MINNHLSAFTVENDLEASFNQLIKFCLNAYQQTKVASTIFTLAQRVKKKVKALFEQINIHLARLLSKTVADKPPDHQDNPEQDRSHWWKEIKNFVIQIQAEELSEAQLRKILEDAFGSEHIDTVMEALEEASEIMEDSTPTLFE